ncbi:MAG: hypothetical protein R2795_22570 [Saprospiraceae bacterium]
MRFPFGMIIRPLGGVGVDRSSKRHDKEKSSAQYGSCFQQYDSIAFVITPEGSRSLRKEWKTGFYHIARMAGVPIVTLGGNFMERTIEFSLFSQAKNH